MRFCKKICIGKFRKTDWAVILEHVPLRSRQFFLQMLNNRPHVCPSFMGFGRQSTEPQFCKVEKSCEPRVPKNVYFLRGLRSLLLLFEDLAGPKKSQR